MTKRFCFDRQAVQVLYINVVTMILLTTCCHSPCHTAMHPSSCSPCQHLKSPFNSLPNDHHNACTLLFFLTFSMMLIDRWLLCISTTWIILLFLLFQALRNFFDSHVSGHHTFIHLQAALAAIFLIQSGLSPVWLSQFKGFNFVHSILFNDNSNHWRLFIMCSFIHLYLFMWNFSYALLCE